MLKSYKLWMAVSAVLLFFSVSFMIAMLNEKTVQVNETLWKDFSDIPFSYQMTDSLANNFSESSPDQLLSTWVADYRADSARFTAQKMNEGFSFSNADAIFSISGFEAAARCGSSTKPASGDYYKIKFSISYQSSIRFKVLDIDDLSYTGCLKENDKSYEFESYLEVQEADTVVLNATFRSVNANRNKFKLSVQLLDKNDSIVDRFPRKSNELEDVIKGSLRSYPLLDTLFRSPKPEYKKLIAKK